MQDSPVIARLIRLLDAGYVVNVKYSVQMGDVLELEHPAGRKRLPEPSLLLRSDGEVNRLPVYTETELRIRPHQTAEFDEFIRCTPKPTWWERNRKPFDLVFAWMFILATWFAFWLIAHYVIGLFKD